jgi:hypothetical protein
VTRSLRFVFAVLALVTTALAAPGLVSPAAAATPIHPDNRPSAIPGASNGLLDASQLLQVAPTCVAYHAAAPSLISMLAAARRDGVRLLPAECYRDYAGQVAAREMWCQRGACHMAAVPGTSNHGWGKAVDFAGMTFDSASYHWLKAHASWFGWNHPGVMEPGGSVPEPWHWEWVGDGGRMFPGMSYGFGSGFGVALGGNPVGHLDAATTGELNGWIAQARVSGWALDPNTTNSIDVHVYVEGTGGFALRANRPRGDIAELFAGYDASPHGFDGSVVGIYGRRQVCAFGINTVVPGENAVLNCMTATFGQDPIGVVDAVADGPNLSVQGWAVDADSAGPVDVHAYVNGQFAGAVSANRSRPDVDAVFPRNGAGHGFEMSLPARQGGQDVCLFAINAGPGTNRLISCTRVTTNRHPIGSLDVAQRVPGGVAVAGWAIDPDTAAPIDVHTYVDDVFAGATSAGTSRPDVGAVFPRYGANHGYAATYAIAPGVHRVCTYGINVAVGSNALLACKIVVV